MNALNVWARGEENKINLLKEIIGSAICNCINLAQSFFLVGDKNNGKSAFLDTLCALVGNNNYSNVSLNDLKDKLYVASLYGKLINCGDDIDFQKICKTSNFKSIVTHSLVTGKFLYDKPFSFRPECTLIFSCNKMPYIDDPTGAIARRVVVVPFETDLSIENNARIDNFLSNIMKEENLQALALIGIDALKRLKSNRFCYTKLPDNKSVYNKSVYNDTNKVDAILSEYISKELSKDAVLGKTASDLYQDFSSWINGLEEKNSISINMFSRAIMAHFDVRSEVRSVGVNGQKKGRRVYISN